MRWRPILIGTGAVVGVVVVGCAGFMGSIFVSFPAAQGARPVDGDLVGIETGGAYAWVVPSATGVVLVDAGMDTTAAALKAEIGERAVHAVFITHGHLDHTAGLAAWSDVPVYTHSAEEGLVRGKESPTGWMPWLFSTIMGSQSAELPNLHTVADGDVIEVDGVALEAIHLPGHTPGSTGWLWNQTLFSGDALVGHGDAVDTLHWSFADDSAQGVASIAKLVDLDIAAMADGHAGVHRDVAPQIQAFVRR